MILIIGVLLGFISVAFGAHSEHGLRPIITDEQFRYLMTAIRYNQVNSVIITVIGLTLTSSHKIANLPMFKWSAKLFVTGAILFSFSIYISVSINIKEITYITPIGGVILMAAWIMLFTSAIQLRKVNTL